MNEPIRKYTYLQEIYSRDHHNFIKLNPNYRRLYMTDIDRLWIERDNDMLPLAMVDLKWSNELYEHKSKIFDHALVTGFVKFCFYILCFVENQEIERYDVIDYITKETWTLNKKQYPAFLLNLRDSEFVIKLKEKQKNRYKDKTIDEIKHIHPNVYNVFTETNTNKDESNRLENEGLHDYFIRRNMKCFCRDCIKKH